MCLYILCRFCGFQGSTSPAKFQTENNVAFIVFKSFDEEFPTDSTANMGFTLYLEASEHWLFVIFFFFSSLRSFTDIYLVI